MKKFLLLIFLLNFSISFSQFQEKHLRREIKKYIEAINKPDFETQIKYMPNFVFDSISREDVLRQLKNVFYEEKNHTMVMDSAVNIDTLATLDHKYYARITVPLKISVDFSDFKGQHGADLGIILAFNEFKYNFGEENVLWDKNEWTFQIMSQESIYGIKKKGHWFFTDLNDMTEKYIPAEIIEP